MTGAVLVVSAAVWAAPSAVAQEARAPAGLEVAVSGSTASLRQYQRGQAYVTVRNTSAAAMTVTKLRASGPRGLWLCPTFAGSACVEGNSTEVFRATLAPGDVRVFRWDLDGRAETGQHPLTFEATYSDGTLTRTAVASTTVQASVLGESGVLDALKISFLFLPGFLALAVFYLLANTRPLPEWVKRLAPNNPEFWVLSVLLSLLAVPMYPWLTGLFGDPRTYLAGYAMRDLVYVWIGSVSAGVALGVAYFAARWLGRSRYQDYVRRRTPAPTDSPLELLTKLAVRARWLPGGVARHSSLWFPQVRLREDDVWLQLFNVAYAASDPPNCWLTPAIEAARSDFGDTWAEFAKAVDADDPKALAVAARKVDGGKALRWAAGAAAGPILVPMSAVDQHRRLGRRLIVQESEV